MSYKTIAEIGTAVRYRYDIEGFTARHPTANLEALIAVAYRDVRDRMTCEGSRLFLSPQEASQTATGVTSGYPGTVLSAFTDVTHVDSVQVKEGSSWYPLVQRFLDDSAVSDDLSCTDIPRYWSTAGVTFETDATGTATGGGLRIVVWPALDKARTFRVVGVRTWADSVANTVRIITDFGIDQYLEAAVGLEIAMRDDDVQLYQARAQEKELRYRELLKRSRSRESGPVQRINVRARGYR